MPSFSSKPKIEELFKETFKSLQCWVKNTELPKDWSLFKEGSVVKYVNVKAIGRVMVNGVEMEFTDVRVYVLPPKS